MTSQTKRQDNGWGCGEEEGANLFEQLFRQDSKWTKIASSTNGRDNGGGGGGWARERKLARGHRTGVPYVGETTSTQQQRQSLNQGLWVFLFAITTLMHLKESAEPNSRTVFCVARNEAAPKQH